MQYGPEDDTLSLYSAIPSTIGDGGLSHHPIPTDLGLAMEDMSMYDTPPVNGRRDYNGDEEYDELRTPLGQNIEHACR